MLIFFFQAEDGIRDTSVTGVQTCALPILVLALSPGATGADLTYTGHTLSLSTRHGRALWRAVSGAVWAGTVSRNRHAGPPRSEERRVGKECRSWWEPEQ